MYICVSQLIIISETKTGHYPTISDLSERFEVAMVMFKKNLTFLWCIYYILTKAHYYPNLCIRSLFSFHIFTKKSQVP